MKNPNFTAKYPSLGKEHIGGNPVLEELADTIAYTPSTNLGVSESRIWVSSSSPDLLPAVIQQASPISRTRKFPSLQGGCRSLKAGARQLPRAQWAMCVPGLTQVTCSTKQGTLESPLESLGNACTWCLTQYPSKTCRCGCWNPLEQPRGNMGHTGICLCCLILATSNIWAPT